MSHIYLAECNGIVEIRADLKRLALSKTADYVNTNYPRVSIESMMLEILLPTEEPYTGYYVVEYSFRFTTYANSEEYVKNLAKDCDTIHVISVD